MKLTIIAATGGVGRQLVAQALDAGHDVTAVARNPAKLPPAVLAGPRGSSPLDLAAPTCRSWNPRSPGPTRCCRRSARTTTRTPGSPRPAPAAIIARCAPPGAADRRDQRLPGRHHARHPAAPQPAPARPR